MVIMDRRQIKSKKAIFCAFSELIKHKHYSKITVNDIIIKADLCRSTFYSHFETKEALLKALCSEIFDHIFSGSMCEYTPIENTLQNKLAHLLMHIKNDQFEIAKILTSDSGNLLMGYLKEYLAKLFMLHKEDFHINLSLDFFINHLVGSFSEAILWWVKRDMQDDPMLISKNFLSLIEKH